MCASKLFNPQSLPWLCVLFEVVATCGLCIGLPMLLSVYACDAPGLMYRLCCGSCSPFEHMQGGLPV